MSTIIDISVSLLNEVQLDSECVDNFIDDRISQFKELKGDEKEFVKEIFLGVIRYEKVLSIVMKGFYCRDGKTIKQSQHYLYRVIAYLALFQLESIGVTTFQTYVMNYNVNKMYKFLNFLCDDRNILTWLRQEWSKVYELTFVKEKLVSPLMSHLSEMNEIVDDLCSLVDCKPKTEVPESAPTLAVNHTIMEPFNLTAVKPRSVPVPEIIELVKKVNKVPCSTYQMPKEQRKLDIQKDLNRRNAEERLMHSTQYQMKCANPDKSEKAKKRMQDIADKEMQKLNFNKSNYQPPPSEKVSNNIPVKLNTVTILREGQLYKDREQKVLKRLENYEAGAKDRAEFDSWQDRMLSADRENQALAAKGRHLAAGIAYEAAIEAKDTLAKDNRVMVQQMKQKAAEHMNRFLKEKIKDEEKNKKLVKGVISGHDNSKIVKKKMQMFKAKIVQKMNEESKELMRIALEEAEVEMRERMQTIYEIRAIENTRSLRVKPKADLSSTAGYQFLGEMSIVELRERLDLAKMQRIKEEDNKRDKIINNKQMKHTQLTDTIDLISRHRTVQSHATAIKMVANERNKVEGKSYDYENEATNDMQKQLNEMKMNRLKQREMSKNSPKPRLPQRDKKSAEENRWAEMEKTREKLVKKICAC